MAGSLSGKRVAIYARYSSTLQRDASIEDQVRRCRELVESREGQFDRGHVFADRAASGTTIHRDGLSEMMHLVETPPRGIDVIVVEDISRLSRNLGDIAKIREKLKFNGVELFSVADGVHSGDPASDLLFGMKGVIAATYIQDLSDKTKRGLDGRALRGLSTGGLPYGYRSEPEIGPNGQVVGARIRIDDERAAVVRRIVARRARNA